MKQILTFLTGMTLVSSSGTVAAVNIPSSKEETKEIKVVSEVIDITKDQIEYVNNDKGGSITLNLTNDGKNLFHYNETGATSAPVLSYKIYRIQTDIDAFKPTENPNEWELVELNSLSAENRFENNNTKNSNQITWGGDVFYPTSAFAKKPHSICDVKKGPMPPTTLPEEIINSRLNRISNYYWQSGSARLQYNEFSALNYTYDTGDKYEFEFIIGSYINPIWSFSSGKSWTNLGTSVTFNYTL
ncbi:unknown protein [Mesoplasma florum L1]|uniref:Uncharacterized protein n=1 Tax=Mesoplasma florum (strain ATCC 33453 / NBRC 100688 / NCTC 11704 / L1) TaxID=265311 RepID=Q6F1C8_MESFL|nr:hypothetical protein [Mesoplasma florum]AAT75695.1 unknown protein [Mesoplasma florum L1]ATI73303.1 hypothetical protein CQZ69_01845 [Mesoplasma florum]ATI73978.1 hypothetical protein CQZ70_01785 [Mesoplasma florum]AVN61704.1 hypothetical protein CG004_01845 [Mesoplasma florum]